MALEGLGVLLGAVLEDADLLALAILQNLSLNLSTCNCGRAELGVSAVNNCQNLIEGHGFFSLRRELLDVDHIALLDVVLLTAGNDNSLHIRLHLPFLS